MSQITVSGMSAVQTEELAVAPDGVAGSGSMGMLWAGRVLSALPAAFLVLDAGMKLVKPKFVVDATVAMRFSEGVIVPLGIILMTSTILYLVPRTAVLGAILLTGYLGGAVATHVRDGAPMLSHTLFPTYLGVMLWLGLYLRDARLRALIPLRQAAAR